MKRSDSSFPQFKQRIPADVRPLAIGRTLSVPLGAETTHITITLRMAMVRFSLKTRDPSEANVRHGQAAAAVERFYATLRNSRPVTLTHKQATALAGDLYRAWADGGGDRTIAVTHTGAGWVRDRCTPPEEGAGFEAALRKLEAASHSGEDSDLEPIVGKLLDRLLFANGIFSVDADTRPILLDAFVRTLRDTFALRQRNAEGDYNPDPKATRFPPFEAPRSDPSPASAASTKTSLTKLVEDRWSAMALS